MSTAQFRMKLSTFSESVFNTKEVNNVSYIGRMKEKCGRTPHAMKNEPERRIYKISEASTGVFPLPKLIFDQKDRFKHFMEYVSTPAETTLFDLMYLPSEPYTGA